MNKYSGRMKAIEAQGARTALTSLPQGKEVVTKQAALKGANINAKRARAGCKGNLKNMDNHTTGTDRKKAGCWRAGHSPPCFKAQDKGQETAAAAAQHPLASCSPPTL